MDYKVAAATIRNEASHVGEEITRAEAYGRLTGDGKRAFTRPNPMNDAILQYRLIAGMVVEIAIADFTGLRGVNCYMCGITVFGYPDLSKCVDLSEVRSHLLSLKETKK